MGIVTTPSEEHRVDMKYWTGDKEVCQWCKMFLHDVGIFVVNLKITISGF